MAQEFDVVIIGAGPGGYVAAIRAAQLGLKTACVEKRETLGGTCLNVGCIPSKALLHATEKLAEIKSGHLKAWGISVGEPKVDLKALMKAKVESVSGLTKGIEFLFKKNKVTWIKGAARFVDQKTLSVALNDGGKETIKAKNIVIATGSTVASLPGVEIDGEQVISSTEALSLAKVPASMIVIGGGYIGLEMGSVWSRLGAEVTVVEFLDRILPGMDGEVSKQMTRILKKQGLDIRTATKVTKVERLKTKVKVTVEPAAGGKADVLEAEKVLVAVGRKPNTDGLDLAKAGLKTDDRGRIPIKENFATAVPGIWAIGDVVEGPMLAHKAEDEGIAVAENIAGLQGMVNHDVIPGVVYTHPEAAMVGKTEEELKAAGVKYRVGLFPMLANSRAKTNKEGDGFVKILADAETDRVLGVHIVSTMAGTMIAEAALAMEFGASAEDIALTCHAHPTHPEAVKEAALAVHKRAIHI